MGAENLLKLICKDLGINKHEVDVNLLGATRLVRTELAGLLKDRERLEWMFKKGAHLYEISDGRWMFNPIMNGIKFGDTPRKAIDAAMEADDVQTEN